MNNLEEDRNNPVECNSNFWNKQWNERFFENVSCPLNATDS